MLVGVYALAMEVPRFGLKLRKDTVHSNIVSSFRRLGYASPQKDQTEAIVQFVSGRDVFVVLPTGSGKSMCYIALPFVFDELRKLTEPKSLVVVMSPLVSLMKDQIKKYGLKGLKCASIGDEMDQAGIVNGQYQIVYSSPEALLRNSHWRDMLGSRVYQEHLIAPIVDEAHCVHSW